MDATSYYYMEESYEVDSYDESCHPMLDVIKSKGYEIVTRFGNHSVYIIKKSNSVDASTEGYCAKYIYNFQNYKIKYELFDSLGIVPKLVDFIELDGNKGILINEHIKQYKKDRIEQNHNYTDVINVLHNEGYVHGDCVGENFVYNSGKILIINIDDCFYLDENDDEKTYVGTSFGSISTSKDREDSINTLEPGKDYYFWTEWDNGSFVVTDAYYTNFYSTRGSSLRKVSKI